MPCFIRSSYSHLLHVPYRTKQQSSQPSRQPTEVIEAYVSTTVSLPHLMALEHCVSSPTGTFKSRGGTKRVTQGQQVENSTRSISGTFASRSLQQPLLHSVHLSASESRPCVRTCLHRLQRLIDNVRIHTKM